MHEKIDHFDNYYYSNFNSRFVDECLILKLIAIILITAIIQLEFYNDKYKKIWYSSEDREKSQMLTDK